MPSDAARRAAVVVNPVKVDLDQLRAVVGDAEHTAGFASSLWLETTADDPGIEMAREAVAQGVDVVLAAGGDGTVRAVAEGLRGSESAMGIVPSGTGNLLARNLGVPLDDPSGCVAAAFKGRTRAIDVATVQTTGPEGGTQEHTFVVMAGIGLDAEMAANAEDDVKKRVGWLAYVKPVLDSMRGGSRTRVRYRVDGHAAHSTRVHTLLVGNCGDLPGKVRLLPDAALDDGVLDVVTLRPDGPLGWAQIWWTVTVDNGPTRLRNLVRPRRAREVRQRRRTTRRPARALRYEQGSRVEVRLRSAQELEIDGDPAGTVTAFTITVEQHGLRVRVPS